jgi:hypothetical protein
VLFDIHPQDGAKATAQSRYAATIDSSDSSLTAKNVMEKLPPDLSRFEVPATVRLSVSQPASGKEITLHFVNYNRQEPSDKNNRGQGIADEKPMPAPESAADFKLPPHVRVQRVEFLTPENEQAQAIEFKQTDQLLRFRVPQFLVYGVIRVQLSEVK